MRNLVLSRTRNRVITDTKAPENFWDNWNGVEPSWYHVPPFNVQKSTEYEDEITYDNVTENYKSRSLAGEVIMNDYKNTRLKTYTPIGTAVPWMWIYGVERPWYKFVCPITSIVNWSSVNFTTLGSAPIDSMAQRTLKAAHAQVEEAAIQMLVTAAEFEKSVKTVTRVLGVMTNLLQKLRRKEKLFRKGDLSLEALADAYLEFRYGLRPMYYDVLGAVEALQEFGEKQRSRFTATETWSDSDSFPQTQNVTTGNRGRWNVQHYSSNRVTVRSGCLAEWVMDGKTAAQLTGIAQWRESLWELVPFSFIIDWFADVGNTIAALSPKIYSNILGSWTIVEEHKVNNYMLTACTLTSGGFAISNKSAIAGMTGLRIEDTKTRYANPKISAIPSWDVRLSVAKIVDLLAIIFMLYLGLRKSGSLTDSIIRKRV